MSFGYQILGFGSGGAVKKYQADYLIIAGGGGCRNDRGGGAGGGGWRSSFPGGTKIEVPGGTHTVTVAAGGGSGPGGISPGQDSQVLSLTGPAVLIESSGGGYHNQPGGSGGGTPNPGEAAGAGN